METFKPPPNLLRPRLFHAFVGYGIKALNELVRQRGALLWWQFESQS
jgi:hypothetical protein